MIEASNGERVTALAELIIEASTHMNGNPEIIKLLKQEVKNTTALVSEGEPDFVENRSLLLGFALIELGDVIKHFRSPEMEVLHMVACILNRKEKESEPVETETETISHASPN